MPRLFLCVTTILLGWASTTAVMPQAKSGGVGPSGMEMVTEQTAGISFLKIGHPLSNTASEYVMALQSSGGSIRSATAGVSVSEKRFVYLPGSCGARLYLDDADAQPLLKNRVNIDTVRIAGLQFRREFWAVYAGMGQWEGVINCYAFHNNQFYTLSLNAGVSLGKPGEVVDGVKISGELLRSRMADILNNTQEPVIQMFNDLLSSFRVNN